MSRKRQGLGDDLTGGTKDVNPQFLSGSLTLSAANTATELTLGTPIVRVGQGANSSRSVIMEILKLWVEMPNVDQDAAGATGRAMQFSMSTTSSGGTPSIFSLANPRCLASIEDNFRNAFTAAGTGLLFFNSNPREVDFTDGAGHGVLVATDNIFLQANTSNQAGAATFNFKILYRFKEVSLVEYIGIVQSQQ